MLQDTSMPLPPQALRLQLDCDALSQNWQVLDHMSGEAMAGAAVKADAYGIGSSQAVPVLRDAGCRDFFVAHWGEVPAVLAHVSASAISVLHGPLNAADAAFACATGVKPVINSVRQAQLWRDAGGGLCDVMIDSGMSRLGLSLSELQDPAVQALNTDVLISHLASADEDVAQNEKQRVLWNESCGLKTHRRRSLANSAGIALGTAYHGDLTRPGIALYGGIPRPEFAGVIRQVARPMAAIMQIRELNAGDAVGYNATYVASTAMRVGIIALGYADGFLRCWSGGAGAMIHAGERLPIIGRVSMDISIIDLALAPNLQEGDWVEVEYDLPNAALRSGLSQYELLTLLGDRFAR